MNQPVLEVKDLTKDYGAYRAVDAVSFSIARGQVMGLLGPNGAGKSTTIQMLTGVTEKTAGTITYFGKNFDKYHQASLQRINYASAYNTLLGRMSVLENMRVFAGLYGVRRPQAKIAELLEYFEISHLARERYQNLSAGERTRTNLAKALLNDPELILMDEPTASLDPDIADKTLSLIETLRRDRQLSILFTSHNMAEVARICDEVIFLNKGKIASRDTPANHTKRLNRTEVLLKIGAGREKLASLLTKQSLSFAEDEPGHFVIQTSGHAVVKLLSEVTQLDIDVQDVEMHKATLEDVFLEIARRKKS